MTILEKIQEYLKDKNQNGLYVPMIRDPKSGMGSVTLTLVFISFNMNVLGLIGKASGLFGSIDLSGANTLFIACLAAYLGRQMQGKNGTISAEVKNEEK